MAMINITRSKRRMKNEREKRQAVEATEGSEVPEVGESWRLYEPDSGGNHPPRTAPFNAFNVFNNAFSSFSDFSQSSADQWLSSRRRAGYTREDPQRDFRDSETVPSNG